MIHRLVALLLMVVCCGSLSSCQQQPAKDRLGRILVQSGAGCGAWSKDSRYLYYPYDGDMCRYDTQTGEKQTYKVDEVPEGDFDVSPDGKSVVYLDRVDYGIFVLSLGTGKTRRIYCSSKKDLLGICWRPQGDILFSQRRTPTEWKEDSNEQVPLESYGVENPGSYNAFVMTPDGKNMENVKSGFYHIFCSVDGSGFAYVGLELTRYHHFSLKTKQDRLIKFPREGGYGNFDLLYLSEKKLVYYQRITNPDGIGWTTKIEAVDLTTMTTKPVDLPVTALYMGISPDYTKLWVIEPGGSDWYNRSSSKLYIMDVPPEKSAEKQKTK